MNRFMYFLFVEPGAASLRWLTAVSMACSSGFASADWDEDLQFHGYLSQGYVHTSDNRFFGDSDDGSFEFTELGLNASFRATPSLLVAGQLLSRRAGDMYDGSPSIDYALVDWTVVNSSSGVWGLKLGRVKNPFGLYNETRDVAFTRPSIFLPQQVYYDKVRNLLLSRDGVHLNGRQYFDFGAIDLDLGVGRPEIDNNVEIAFLGQDFPGHVDTGPLVYIGRLGFEANDGRWRLALSGASIDLEYERAAIDAIDSGEVNLTYWVASVQYNAERWSLTAEYSEEPVEFDGFGSVLDAYDGTADGYYLQGSYLVRDDMELVLRYGEGYRDDDDRDGAQTSALSGGLVPAYNFFQKDWMIGLRWDVAPNFMLRAEYQWNEGTWSLSPRENPDPGELVKDWRMFSVLGSYRF